MDLNSNANVARLRDSTDACITSSPALAPQHSGYFNISNYQYNIVTNRQKPNRTSLPALVGAETRANRLKTCLHYWNNENFFDPIRNSKERFDAPSNIVKRRSRVDLVEMTRPTPLPVIRVTHASRMPPRS